MAIRTTQAPPGAANALRAGLGQMRGAPEARELTALRTGDPQLAEGVPHETYHLGLDAIQQRRGVDAAEQVGWRYLLAGNEREATVAAEVQQRAGTFEFAGLNQGPFVRQMLDAMKRADVAGEFAPRLLRIPAIYVAALWLKDLQGDNDRYLVLEPANPEVPAGRLYSKPEFEEAIARAAAAMAAVQRPGEDRGPRAP